jgi:hypothetical protein
MASSLPSGAANRPHQPLPLIVDGEGQAPEAIAARMVGAWVWLHRCSISGTGTAVAFRLYPVRSPPTPCCLGRVTLTTKDGPLILRSSRLGPSSLCPQKEHLERMQHQVGRRPAPRPACARRRAISAPAIAHNSIRLPPILRLQLPPARPANNMTLPPPPARPRPSRPTSSPSHTRASARCCPV